MPLNVRLLIHMVSLYKIEKYASSKSIQPVGVSLSERLYFRSQPLNCLPLFITYSNPAVFRVCALDGQPIILLLE